MSDGFALIEILLRYIALLRGTLFGFFIVLLLRFKMIQPRNKDFNICV